MALAVCQLAAAQKFGPVNNIADVDREANRLKTRILKAPSDYSVTGTIYYVSQEGSDDNDGLSEETPIQTIEKLNSMKFERGDAVLFRRGDLWRGKLKAANGVSYSAYGSGPKPRLYGSPFDAAKTGKWTETDKKGVYAFSEKLSKDVGTLVFDEGESGCAFKITKKIDYEGNTFHIETGKPFNNYKDMERDLDMWHDLSDGTIYLCSLSGNPAQRFKSIELLIHDHNITISWGGASIDNLCIKYSGSHGIGASTKVTPFLKVTNCEIGWIGGSIQFDNPKPKAPGKFSRPTRYGNGIEIWGGTKEFIVDHNYFYQCYDAAITHQFSAKFQDINMANITYSNNLVENCVYGIEYFYSIKDEFIETCKMDNVLFKGNIIRMSGSYSWGYQRHNKESPAAIKTWPTSSNKATNFRIENNILDRGNPRLIDIYAAKEEWLPVCRGNIYVQQEGLPVGTGPEKDARVIFVDEKVKSEPTPYTPEPEPQPVSPQTTAKQPATGQAAPPSQLRIILLGDSTCANSDPIASSQRGWGQLLYFFFNTEEIKVENNAVGGTSSKTFREMKKYAIIKKKFAKGDIVTIQFGINDAGENMDRYTSPEEFEEYLRLFVSEIRGAGARPVLLTPVALRQFYWNAGIKVDENRLQRAEIIKKVGKEEKVPVIDCLFLTEKWLDAKGDEASKSYYAWFDEGAYPEGRFASGRRDNTHLNQAGAYEVAFMMAKELVSLFPELKKNYIKAKYKDVEAVYGKIPYYSGN